MSVIPEDDELSAWVNSLSSESPVVKKKNNRATALQKAADDLGVDAGDLGSIISFETGGTFDPHKVGGEGNRYKGLIQFGPDEQRKYYRPNDTFETQLEKGVVPYFRDRFAKAGKDPRGASLEDLYTTVIAGNPAANRNARDSFGTSARSGTQKILNEHRPKVLKDIFGGQDTRIDPDSIWAGIGDLTDPDEVWAGIDLGDTPAQPDPNKPATEHPDTMKMQRDAAVDMNVKSRYGVHPTTPEQDAELANDPALQRFLDKDDKPVYINVKKALQKRGGIKGLKDINHLRTWTAKNPDALTTIIGIDPVNNVGDDSRGIAVTAQKNGREAATAVVTSPEGAIKQAENYRDQFPDAQIGLTTSDDIVAQRAMPPIETLGGLEGVEPDTAAPMTQAGGLMYGDPRQRQTVSPRQRIAQKPVQKQQAGQPLMTTSADLQSANEYLNSQGQAPLSQEQFDALVKSSKGYGEVTGAGVQAIVDGDKQTPISEYEQETPAYGGSVRFPREVGKPTDENGDVGRFRTTEKMTEAQAFRASLLAVGSKYGIDPEKVEREVRSRGGKGFFTKSGGYTPGAEVVIDKNSLIAMGVDPAAFRMEETQNRVEQPLSLKTPEIKTKPVLTPEQEETAKGLGRATYMTPDFGVTTGILKDVGEGWAPFLSGVYQTSFGAAKNVIQDLVFGQHEDSDAVTKALEKGGAFISKVAEGAKREGALYEAGEFAGEVGAAAPRYIVTTVGSGGNPIVGMAAEAGLRGVGRGDDPDKVLGAIGKGAALGVIFHGSSKLGDFIGKKVFGKVVDAETRAALENPVMRNAYNDAIKAGEKVELSPNLKKAVFLGQLAKNTTRLGTVGTFGTAEGLAEGQDIRTAAKQGALWMVQDVALSYLMGGKGRRLEDLEGRVIRVPDESGKPKDILLLKGEKGLDAHDVTGVVPVDPDAVVLPQIEGSVAKNAEKFIPKLTDEDVAKAESGAKQVVKEGAVIGEPKIEVSPERRETDRRKLVRKDEAEIDRRNVERRREAESLANIKPVNVHNLATDKDINPNEEWFKDKTEELTGLRNLDDPKMTPQKLLQVSKAILDGKFVVPEKGFDIVSPEAKSETQEDLSRAGEIQKPRLKRRTTPLSESEREQALGVLRSLGAEKAVAQSDVESGVEAKVTDEKPTVADDRVVVNVGMQTVRNTVYGIRQQAYGTDYADEHRLDAITAKEFKDLRFALTTNRKSAKQQKAIQQLDDWQKRANLRETITPADDTPVGVNSAGEKLYERSDGSRYRMVTDRKDRPNGYPSFGGDLAPVESAVAGDVRSGQPKVGGKRISDKFYIHHVKSDRTSEYIEVSDAKPIVIPGAENLDLFISKKFRGGDLYQVTEAVTGNTLGWPGKTQKEAIKNATISLERQGVEKTLKMIQGSSDRTPRYASPTAESRVEGKEPSREAVATKDETAKARREQRRAEVEARKAAATEAAEQRKKDRQARKKAKAEPLQMAAQDKENYDIRGDVRGERATSRIEPRGQREADRGGKGDAETPIDQRSDARSDNTTSRRGQLDVEERPDANTHQMANRGVYTGANQKGGATPGEAVQSRTGRGAEDTGQYKNAGLTTAEIAAGLNRFSKSGDLRQHARRIKDFTRDEKVRLVENLRAGDDPLEAIKDAKGYEAPFGPGAANVGDVPSASAIKQLGEAIEQITSEGSKIKGAVSATLNRAKGFQEAVAKADAIGTGKGWLNTTMLRMRAGYDWYAKRKPVTDYKKVLGDFLWADQKSAHETRRFFESIKKAVPDARTQEAITNYIQADGDAEILQRWADGSKGRAKLGYERALKLSDNEKVIATQLQSYYEAKLQEGIELGLISDAVENYVNQVWARKDPLTNALRSQVQRSLLDPNFRFSKKRTFQDFFAGEQAGFKPITKQIGDLASFYNQAFERAKFSRQFIKELQNTVAEDGRPAVAISGMGATVPKGEATPDAVLINPKAKTKEIGDYKTIDHPALRGWKWVAGTGEDGTPVMLKGDLVVHPEVYKHLKNVLGTSAMKKHALGRGVLRVQSTLKQTMLSMSGFHQVQEGVHALGHRVSPWRAGGKDFEIDFDDPKQKSLIQGGLQVASHDALGEFSEGITGGNLVNKAPFVGKYFQRYQDWLFKDYIPRLKMVMALHALERNTKRYAKKLDAEQIAELTAEQSNAAFGELNYRHMGRNPTFQDGMRTFLLAPDFLEARGRFTGQALKPFGREQMAALALLAVTQFILARLLNQWLDDDPHWDVQDAFRVYYKGHWYGLRTVPGDIIHLISDPRSFTYHRMSPLMRGGVEAITGRNAFGEKIGPVDVMKDMAPVPLALRRKTDDEWWEPFINSFGLQEGKQKTDADKVIQEYYQRRFPNGFPKSDDPEKTQLKKDALKKIRAGTMTDEELEELNLTPDDIEKLEKTGKLTPLQVKLKTFPVQDAIDVWNAATPAEKAQIRDIVLQKVNKAQDDIEPGDIPDDLQDVQENGKPVQTSFKDDRSFIGRIVTYSKAIGADPVDAFKKWYAGETIRRTDNGIIIVDRMTKEQSQQVKRERGAAKTMRLDHNVPLELGGTNETSNLKLVDESEWARYTPVENALGRELRAGRISGTKARDLLQQFKLHNIGEQDIEKEIGRPIPGQRMIRPKAPQAPQAPKAPRPNFTPPPQ